MTRSSLTYARSCEGPLGRCRFLPGEVHRPMARGKLRSISRGVYTAGPLKGSDCVIKWFPKGGKNEQEFFAHDIFASDRALDIVEAWNKRGVSGPISLCPTNYWVFKDEQVDCCRHGVLVEPFMANFAQWNSNSGWADTRSKWGRVMQGLSHFSYEFSGGKYLLCDLQGGALDANSAIVISPVVCSANRQFGLSDLGQCGIDNFFARHKCTEYCRKRWARPNRLVRTFTARRSTRFWDKKKHCYV